MLVPAHSLFQKQTQSTHLYPFAMKLKNETSMSTADSIRPFKRTLTLFPSNRDFIVPRVRLFFILVRTKDIHLARQIPSHRSPRESPYWQLLSSEHFKTTSTYILFLILNLVVLNLDPSIVYVHDRVIFLNEHDRSAALRVLIMKSWTSIHIPLNHHRISSRWDFFTLGVYMAINISPVWIHDNDQTNVYAANNLNK